MGHRIVYPPSRTYRHQQYRYYPAYLVDEVDEFPGYVPVQKVIPQVIPRIQQQVDMHRQYVSVDHVHGHGKDGQDGLQPRERFDLDVLQSVFPLDVPVIFLDLPAQACTL